MGAGSSFGTGQPQPPPNGQGLTEFVSQIFSNGLAANGYPFYTTWTPSVTALPVSATFDLSLVNNVIPPNLGWEHFPNQVDEVDGAPDYSQEHDVLITLGALSATKIVPDGVNASPAPTSSISNADAPPVVEGTTGPLFATFTVTLSSPPIGDTITVDYATQDGTAKAGTDYTAKSGTLTFAPGQTTATISVPITNHNLASETEAFNVVLSNPVDLTTGSPPTITRTAGTATL